MIAKYSYVESRYGMYDGARTGCSHAGSHTRALSLGLLQRLMGHCRLQVPRLPIACLRPHPTHTGCCCDRLLQWNPAWNRGQLLPPRSSTEPWQMAGTDGRSYSCTPLSSQYACLCCCSRSRTFHKTWCFSNGLREHRRGQRDTPENHGAIL